MTRVVFDCMIYIQALSHPTHSAGLCIRAVEKGLFQLVVSESTLAEFRDVISRPKLRKNYPHVTAEDVEKFIEGLQGIALVVKDVPAVFHLPRDTKDEKYINLAIASQAIYVVSRDNDLLDLMTRDDDSAIELRTKYPELKILRPESFLLQFEIELLGSAS